MVVIFKRHGRPGRSLDPFRFPVLQNVRAQEPFFAVHLDGGPPQFGPVPGPVAVASEFRGTRGIRPPEHSCAPRAAFLEFDFDGRGHDDNDGGVIVVWDITRGMYDGFDPIYAMVYNECCDR